MVRRPAVIFVAVFGLLSCEEPVPDDGAWIETDAFPCDSTASLNRVLADEPHPDSPFLHLAAAEACGRIGKVFSGTAQCIDRRIEVTCKTSPQDMIDLPYLCGSTDELFRTDWKLDAADDDCARLGRFFTGDVRCAGGIMQAQCTRD